MSDFNPYTPPQTNPVPESALLGEAPLASPWIRLGASLIDALIVGAINVPIMYLGGYFSRVAVYAQKGQRFIPEAFLWSAIGLVIMIALNWAFLQQGQTIGKKLLGLKILRKDGSPIPATQIILRRLVPVQVVALIPILGSVLVIIDALLIFRQRRNTMHDDIADTKVVKLS